MNNQQHSPNHPLFERLAERASILEKISSDVLPEKLKQQLNEIKTKKPYDIDIAASLSSDITSIIAKIISSDGNIDDQRKLTYAYLDILLDADYNKTAAALMNHQDSIRKPLVKLANEKIGAAEPFVVRTTLLLLGIIESEVDSKCTKESIACFSKSACSLLSLDKDSPKRCVEALKRGLRNESIRVQVRKDGGIKKIIEILKQYTSGGTRFSIDTIYHLLFCIWAFTFSEHCAPDLCTGEFTEILAKLLATTNYEYEEIIRVLIAITSRLLNYSEFVDTAYDYDIRRHIGMHYQHHFTDTGIKKELKECFENLDAQLKSLSLWDKYVREVRKDKLKMTMIHKSDIFWKTNIERFAENDLYVLKLLTEHLKKGNDPETVSVACHDIGEYANRHPLAKPQIAKIKAKELIMNLIKSDNKMIQKEALRTSQLLLLRSF